MHLNVINRGRTNLALVSRVCASYGENHPAFTPACSLAPLPDINRT